MQARHSLAWAAILWATLAVMPTHAAVEADNTTETHNASQSARVSTDLIVTSVAPHQVPPAPIAALPGDRESGLSRTESRPEPAAHGTALGGLLSLLRSAGDERSPRLAELRLSRRLLEQSLAGEITCESDVEDEILGTQLRGRAITRGTTSLRLEPDADQAVLHVTFSGTVHSQTRGTNGPVVLHSEAETTFTAQKKLVLCDQGLHGEPTEVQAKTRSHVGKIESRLSGLRGRIAESVARRRSDELRPQADAIAAERAAQRIGRAIDERVALATERLAGLFAAGGLARTPGDRPPRIRFRSSEDCVELLVDDPSAGWLDAPQAAAVPTDDLLSLRAHQSFVRRLLTSGPGHDLWQRLTAFAGWRASELGRASDAAGSGKLDVAWSDDGQWLSVTYRSGSHSSRAAQVTTGAVESPSTESSATAVADKPAP